MSYNEVGVNAKSQLVGAGVSEPQTQISGSVARIWRAIELLENNGVSLGDRIQHALRPEETEKASDSKEPSFDCPLAETLAAQARRIEAVAYLLNNLRFRVEL